MWRKEEDQAGKSVCQSDREQRNSFKKEQVLLALRTNDVVVLSKLDASPPPVQGSQSIRRG